MSLSRAARRSLSVRGRAECQKAATWRCTAASESPNMTSRGGLSFACKKGGIFSGQIVRKCNDALQPGHTAASTSTHSLISFPA